MPLARSIRKPAAIGRRLVQLTLDFFSPAQPAGPATVAESPDLKQKTPYVHVDAAPVAIKSVALQSAPALDSYIHPRATRQVLLGGRQVGYEVKRGKRRTIGFCVGSDGLAVSAPKWVALHEIDQAVQAKSSWILKKLAGARERLQQIESARIDWKAGACFLYLGEPVQIALELGPVRGSVQASAQTLLEGETDSNPAVRQLRLSLPADAPAEKIRQAVQLWLMQQARERFTVRLDFFAPQLGVQWRKLGLSNATTRWGSASSNGTIRLNWRLIHFRPEVVDYVVVHELSHLRFMDHSPRFWATVESILPNHATLRRQLKKEPLLS